MNFEVSDVSSSAVHILRRPPADANEEIANLKEQITAAQDRAPVEIPPSPAALSTRTSQYSAEGSDNLLSTPAPPELQLADLMPPPATPAKPLPPIVTTTPRTSENIAHSSSQATLLHKAGFRPHSASTASPSGLPSPLARSSTHPPPLSNSSRMNSRAPSARPVTIRAASTATTSTTGAASASRGVQMLSEMRARVEVLGQKIHTRVPRIRMGSVSSRPNSGHIVPPLPPKAGPSSVSSPSVSSSKSSLRSQSPEKPYMSKIRRESLDLESDMPRTPVGNTSGWVLIMEDTPSPLKDKELRRMSGPVAPSSFRGVQPMTTTPPSPSESRSTSALSQSHIPTGIRRPQSRLSDGRSSISTNATSSTVSSIPTPVSRPSTPTFLPIPTSGLYSTGNNLKRSSGPSSGAYSSQPKRSSLGSSTIISMVPERQQPTKIRSPALAQSRIGRPTPSSPRKGINDDFTDAQLKFGRSRAGSASLMFGRHAT